MSCPECPIVCLCTLYGAEMETLEPETKRRIAEHIAELNATIEDMGLRILEHEALAKETVATADRAKVRAEAAVKAMNAYIILSLTLLDALRSTGVEPVLIHRERIQRLRKLAIDRYAEVQRALGEDEPAMIVKIDSAQAIVAEQESTPIPITVK